jgi:hypothetical protein
MNQEECIICHEFMLKVNITITGCNHKFHSDCLINWAKKNNSCPCCRKKLYQSTLLVNQNNIENRNYVEKKNNVENQNNIEKQNNVENQNNRENQNVYDFKYECITIAKYILINSNIDYLPHVNKFHNLYFYNFCKRFNKLFTLSLFSKIKIIEKLRNELNYTYDENFILNECKRLKIYVEQFLGEEKVNRWKEEKNGIVNTNIYYNRDSFNLDSKWYKRMWKSREENDKDLSMELYNLIDWCIEIYRR